MMRDVGGQADGDAPAIRGAEAAARPRVRARRQLDVEADGWFTPTVEDRGRRRYLNLDLDPLVRVRVRSGLGSALTLTSRN